jgi:hypothetical protein
MGIVEGRQEVMANGSREINLLNVFGNRPGAGSN